MFQVLPEYLSQWTTDRVRSSGVKVLPNCEIAKCTSTVHGRMILHMNDGSEVEVDHAVVALGIDANEDLAKNSQLEIDEVRGGFRVNAELEARCALNKLIVNLISCFSR